MTLISLIHAFFAAVLIKINNRLCAASGAFRIPDSFAVTNETSLEELAG